MVFDFECFKIYKKQMNTPLISVIIPTFNYGNYIAEAIYSVINQTYTNWECIIVDDGSVDNTAQVVTQIINDYPNKNIKYYFIKNSGTSAAKNYGIKISAGEYIQFLDADDTLAIRKFETAIRIFKQVDCALVFGTVVFFSCEKESITLFNKYPCGYLSTESLTGAVLIKKLVENNFATISSPFVKASFVKKVEGFNIDINHNEDWLFWMRVALENPLFIFDNSEEIVAKIRVHNTSAMNNNHKMFIGEKIVRLKFNKEIEDSKYLSLIEKTILKKLNNDLLALHEIRTLSLKLGLKYVLVNFFSDPRSNYKLIYKSIKNICSRMFKGYL